MSDPLSGNPDPGMSRPPIRRRFQPQPMQEALRIMRKAVRATQDLLRPAQPGAQGALRRAQRVGNEAIGRAQRFSNEAVRQARRQGQDLWLKGKRNPRTVGLTGGAVALTLVGAFALSASGAGKSLCPPTKGKTPQFSLLVDRVPQVAAGSTVEIHYDVCGLPSGAFYRGRVQLAQQPRKGAKKGAAKPKPLVVSFRDQVDGVATRRQQELNLGSTKPGAYTLELVVSDKRGRERKRVQKVLIKAVGR